VVLVGIHVYFGLHVIRRGIIFVDLSLAQVAALGTTLAFLVGFELDGTAAYLFSLAFALAGGALFALTRGVEGKVPQEAIIGIVYAVSSAAAILAVSHSPEGAEHIRYLLVGSILTVTPVIVLKTAVVYLAVGLFHYLVRERFLALSFGARAALKHRLWWELLFYGTFGIVVTSSVKICGVLLVFIFLVVPSVFAALVTESIGRRLALGWAFGLVGSALGLILSFVLDTPTGATIVCTFGLMLVVLSAARPLLMRR
jgi:zinc/manganese transport system permease protein